MSRNTDKVSVNAPRRLHLEPWPFLVCVLLMARSATAAEIVTSMNWPLGWVHAEPVKSKNAYVLQAEQDAFSVASQKLQLTILQAQSGPHGGSASDIQSLAELLRDGTASLALEKNLLLLPFAKGHGFYFSATRKVEPAHHGPYYKQLVQGVWRSGAYVVSFSLLTHDATAEDAKAILTSMESLQITEPGIR